MKGLYLDVLPKPSENKYIFILYCLWKKMSMDLCIADAFIENMSLPALWQAMYCAWGTEQEKTSMCPHEVYSGTDDSH